MSNSDAKSNENPSPTNSNPTETARGMALRAAVGGTLMGLANLVPGISGGTMLLATGVYPKFVSAIAQITRFRFRREALLVLCTVVGSAGLTILLLAGLVKSWVVDYPWVMYSLFIGLTLGGVPVVWSMIRRMNAAAMASALAGFLLMVVLAVAQSRGWVGHAESGRGMLFVAGLAGASAMILPGISGGYLLLMLGQYVPILGAIDQARQALRAGDLGALAGPFLNVILPVGLGVVIGVVVVGNLLEWLLKKFRKATLGFLLGLLVGSVAALYPFRQAVPPQPGQSIKGQVVTVENSDQFDLEDWPFEFYRPEIWQALAAMALVAAGFSATWGIDRWGRQFRIQDDEGANSPPADV